jgi:hypothetical protein
VVKVWQTTKVLVLPISLQCDESVTICQRELSPTGWRNSLSGAGTRRRLLGGGEKAHAGRRNQSTFRTICKPPRNSEWKEPRTVGWGKEDSAGTENRMNPETNKGLSLVGPEFWAAAEIPKRGLSSTWGQNVLVRVAQQWKHCLLERRAHNSRVSQITYRTGGNPESGPHQRTSSVGVGGGRTGSVHLSQMPMWY